MATEDNSDGLARLTDTDMDIVEDLPKKQGTKIEDPKVQVYRCGDIVFTRGAVKKWRLQTKAAVDILYNRSKGQMVVRFKAEYKNDDYYALSDKRGSKLRCIQAKSKLSEIDKVPPVECVECDFTFYPDNQLVEIDLTNLPRY